MGNCFGSPDKEEEERTSSAPPPSKKPAPQSRERNATPQAPSTAAEETSTVIRENLINLHAKAKRASVEGKEDAVATASASASASASAATPEVMADQSSEKQMQTKPPEGGYKRLKNVFAAPLEILDNYVAPLIPKSSSETEFLDKCLHDNFIFAGLTPKERTLLINSMEHYHAKEGDNIIEQGDIGDYFYILQRGRVTFLVDGKKVGQARKGGSFGELALLYDSPRAATARADTDCTLFRVDQQTFRVMLANNKAKSSKENIEVLRKVEFFKDVETPILTKISDALTTITFHDGEFILRKGEVGKVFYIIKQGKVIITDIGGGEKKYLDQTLSVGDFFGERALMTGEKRAANVKAIGDCVMLCLTKDTFEKILGKLQDVIDKAMDKRKIMGVPIFAKANLEQYEIDQLADKLQNVSFEQGETIVKEGDDSSQFGKLRGLWLIKEGKITMSAASGGVNILIKGDYLGEISLTVEENIKAQATYVATEETHCKIIYRDDIIKVIGSLDRLAKTSSVMITKLDPSITMDVLRKKTILGAGTFGQVWLVTHKEGKEPYALKIQNKRELIKHGQVDGVIREKNLMASIDHPFVIKLVNAFQDNRNLFMVMQLIQGGELFSVIHTDTSDGVPESAAKFYAAGVLEGLSYMHNRHILYRDLKPENVLIDNDGYCVLIDLGFAKVVTDKTYTLCGTPLYLAPEIILSRGYDKGVDHWSLGVLIYEMILGYSPFYSHNIDQMTLFKRIVKVQYIFPDWAECSEDAQDLIERILVMKQTERLGSLARGDADIRDHPWLDDMPRSKLIDKKIKAPWVPKLKNSTDVSNFENWDHLEDKQETGLPAPPKKEQHLFDNF